MSLKRAFTIKFAVQCAMALGLAILTGALFRSLAALSRSQQAYMQSYLLADELRQSSDDLTRMARSYVATGNPEYERQYGETLAIREGRSPRPTNYNRIYWDLVAKSGDKPRPDGERVSLQELMIRAGFTASEFERLAQAEKHSNALVQTERIAMNAVKGLYADEAGNFTLRGQIGRAHV